MAWQKIVIRGTAGKRCAFCRHWYDPTNSAIRPHKPRVGIWEYDHDCKNYCSVTNLDKRAWQTCKRFEFKFEM